MTSRETIYAETQIHRTLRSYHDQARSNPPNQRQVRTQLNAIGFDLLSVGRAAGQVELLTTKWYPANATVDRMQPQVALLTDYTTRRVAHVCHALGGVQDSKRALTMMYGGMSPITDAGRQPLGFLYATQKLPGVWSDRTVTVNVLLSPSKKVVSAVWSYTTRAMESVGILWSRVGGVVKSSLWEGSPDQAAQSLPSIGLEKSPAFDENTIFMLIDAMHEGTFQKSPLKIALPRLLGQANGNGKIHE